MVEKLGGYNLVFRYVLQKLNRVADALSRFPVEEAVVEEESEEKIQRSIQRVFLGTGDTEIFPKDICELAEMANSDEKYKFFVNFFEGEQDWSSVEGDVLS